MRAVRSLRGNAIPENGEAGVAIRGVTVTRGFHVAKHLIVSAIFLDDVDNVLDRAGSGKQFGWRETHQTIVLHSLLRVMR